MIETVRVTDDEARQRADGIHEEAAAMQGRIDAMCRSERLGGLPSSGQRGDGGFEAG